MDNHVKTLGWIFVLSGALCIAVALFVGVAVTGAGLLSGDAETAAITGGVGLFVAVLLGLLAVPSILTGLALHKYRPWARIAGIVLSVLNLPGFPIGTLIGGYGLWVLLNDETAARFREASYA